MKAAACMICKQGIAKFSCVRCGSLVCENCFDNNTGMCVACKRGRLIKK